MLSTRTLVPAFGVEGTGFQLDMQPATKPTIVARDIDSMPTVTRFQQRFCDFGHAAFSAFSPTPAAKPLAWLLSRPQGPPEPTCGARGPRAVVGRPGASAGSGEGAGLTLPARGDRNIPKCARPAARVPVPQEAALPFK